MRQFSLTTHSFCPLLLLALLAPTTAVAQEKRPTALEIFDAGLAEFEYKRWALRNWQYQQTLITHQLDSAGNVVARGVWKSIVRPGDPRPLEYTSERIEGRLSFFKPGNSESSSPVRPSQEAKAKGEPEEKNQAESTIEAVRKYNLRDRYHWKRLPDESVSGESAYVIEFQPKPRQNTTSREERFFGLLAGRIWISRRDYSTLKAEAALQSPCHLFWIIAQVTTFQFTYNLEPTHGVPRILRLSRATVKTAVTFPFYTIQQQHWLTVDKFEPRTARGLATKNPHPSFSPRPEGSQQSE